ncbi:hypothetical protein D6D19_05431 [Aureobasidium pullulans]|uniref:Uncharacterized protein n=2 Tax=Aureobasidium pullulans TaxID=5580 RepID=A0A074XQG1_AURPU|nr:uncharacterized protein M438DRAFT_342956 [Aureobasidium pullulans EXF-150]THV72520.1 hypothetical protein D6D28_03914 [Aureobasidium pullulans]KEQ87828.1 hypothetical protein M438DRAFT_342956 [Aureobasidium pullulans EXF-150]THV99272.1 hypothetical protein D6D27_01029 [Aureobasidium pullulans]THW73696.1 hypothetical protein D6D19_05431 [Aureobasidium pullulans]THX07748.1 hypothetical protein D6D18_02179 [Aureobasidium pullulans]
MATPNVRFGSPIIFFDSHPEQQNGYIASWVYAFRDHLKIAWTGDVPKKLFPGTLRLVWWTTDGVQGLRDFELHQSELIKSLWDSLLDNPDVARALVTGYSGQNPYVLSYGDNPWLTKEQKERLVRRQNDEIWAKKSAKRVETRSKEDRFEDEKEAIRRKEQILEHIDEVIQSNEDAEKEKLLGAEREYV